MDGSEEYARAADATRARAAPAGSRAGFMSRLGRALAEWWARAAARQLLAQFDERMLRDIGIDPARVWRETGKWFWQP